MPPQKHLSLPPFTPKYPSYHPSLPFLTHKILSLPPFTLKAPLPTILHPRNTPPNHPSSQKHLSLPPLTLETPLPTTHSLPSLTPKTSQKHPFLLQFTLIRTPAHPTLSLGIQSQHPDSSYHYTSPSKTLSPPLCPFNPTPPHSNKHSNTLHSLLHYSTSPSPIRSSHVYKTVDIDMLQWAMVVAL